MHRGGAGTRPGAGVRQPLEVAPARFRVAEGLRRQQRRGRPRVFFLAAALRFPADPLPVRVSTARLGPRRELRIRP